MGARPSDLAILSTAASQLFESTRDMSTDAVISIMTALMQVSTKMVPEAAKQPGQPKKDFIQHVQYQSFQSINLYSITFEAAKQPGQPK